VVVTPYWPGGRFRKCTSPEASEVWFWFDGPDSSTSAPGTTPPWASCTVTSMRPWNRVCAEAENENNNIRTTAAALVRM
jgi:hypothetical protein